MGIRIPGAATLSATAGTVGSVRSGMRVIAVAGLPDGVEVRASARRRRTVTAYREQGRTVVLVPERMARAQILAYVQELVGRLEARERRTAPSDADLAARAAALSRRYLAGRAVPTSVRWVGNQQRRWGSCTPLDGTIRLSQRLHGMPSYVVDYVLLHELAHLLVAGHGPDFEACLASYPRLAEARAFLAGVDHAGGLAHEAHPGARPDTCPDEAHPDGAHPDDDPVRRDTLW